MNNVVDPNDPVPFVAAEERVLQRLGNSQLSADEIMRRAGGELKRGTVYATCQRMERKGYLSSKWLAQSRRRVYRATAIGRKALRTWILAERLSRTLKFKHRHAVRQPSTLVPRVSKLERLILASLKYDEFSWKDLAHRLDGVVKPNTLYVMCRRMSAKGYLDVWSESTKRRQVYRVTSYGRAVLDIDARLPRDIASTNTAPS